MQVLPCAHYLIGSTIEIIMKIVKDIQPYLLVLLLVLSYGCKNNNEKAQIERIKDLYSRKMNMNLDSMLIVNPVDKKQMYKYGKYNFVLYVDSNNCSSCTLGTLEKWDTFLCEINSCNDIGFYPIFSPPKSQLFVFINQAKAQYAGYPILVDTVGVFKKRNSFLPSEQLYNTFLIDSTGSIIVVGTPINNPAIEEIIKRRIKKQK